MNVPLLSTAIAVAIALVVLLDLLLSHPLLDALGAALVEYGVIVAYFALLLGVLNVLNVHARKIQLQEEGWPYSFVLIALMLFLIVVGIVGGLDNRLLRLTVAGVLLPLQAAFFSLLAFWALTVTYRAARIRSVESALFVGAAILMILGATPVGSNISPLLVDARAFLLAVPVTAGMRALLLGIALGTVATGLRLLYDGRHYFK